MEMKKKFLVTLSLVCLALPSSNCRQEDPFYSNVLRSDVYIQLYDNHKYDFLWVFDNSDSMSDKRNYVRDHMANFLTVLNGRKAVAYNMVISTTDYFTDAGKLIKSPTGLEVVRSESVDPVADFASIINNVANSGTSFWEQGLESAYHALLNNGSKFMRKGVPLVIIVVSDENSYDCDLEKSSKGGIPGCFGGPPEKTESDRVLVFHPTSRYVDYFRDIKKNEKSHTLIFPIIGLETSRCIDEANGQGSVGKRYREVQQAIGAGAIGGICDDQLPKSYENIARVIADRGVRFTLSSPASGHGISVFVNEQTVPYSKFDGFIYEEETNSIIFSGKAIPKNGDLIEVLYSELTN